MNTVELFNKGYNCSQSVLVPFARKFNLDENTALRLMSPFGGGISHTDNICGAVTGGIAAIGLHLGHSAHDDEESKAKCNEATRKFINEFKKKYGCTSCSGLINYNLSNSRELEEARNSGIFKTKCTELVEYSSQLAEKILNP